MAAGFSKRMGCQKLLLPYGPQSLLRHVVKKRVEYNSKRGRCCT
ncbi:MULTISPECIES: NTP transferase domain-containing protein [Brevibacillus]|uniref:MobA-like NTP transferase domain-containing protein n=1 Tax=Brevibacillus nitrificans TaxID=651560 RepID=A0A3M8DB86_9BACL|nr:hypothetical protein EDM59_12680 [Brevibacillus nitrificans]